MEPYRRQDQYGGMLEGPTGGLPDYLWRSALALAAYGIMWLDGILSCITQVAETNGISRHPNYQAPNTSRDAICMMLVALWYRFPGIAGSMARELPCRISDRYTHTPSSYRWVKMIANKKWYSRVWNGWLYSIMCLVDIIPRLVNFPFKWIGLKDEKWYPNFYTIHMVAWMLWACPPNPFRFIGRRLILLCTPKSNLLIRGLCDKKIDPNQAIARTKWQWQRLPWVEYTGIENQPISSEEVGYALDIDILHIFE